MARKTTEQFIQDAKQLHGDKYDYSKVQYINCSTKVKIICPIHGIFEQSPNSHVSKKTGCGICGNIKKTKTTEQFIQKAILVHNNKYDYSLVKYIHSSTKVKIICPTHGEFLQNSANHLLGHGCYKCKTKTTEQFIVDAKQTHGDKYSYSLVEYKNTTTKVIIICPTHGIFEQSPGSHLSGYGCYKCKTTSLNSFVDRSSCVHFHKYDYSLVEYINNSTKVKIICPIHGEFLQRPDKHILQRTGCPICNISKGETIIYQWLIRFDISFIAQYNPIQSNKKIRFDFFLPDLNIMIEFDGRQHYESVKFYGGDDAFYSTQQRDIIKNKYCETNNIQLIRIPYWELDKVEVLLSNSLLTLINVGD